MIPSKYHNSYLVQVTDAAMLKIHDFIEKGALILPSDHDVPGREGDRHYLILDKESYDFVSKNYFNSYKIGEDGVVEIVPPVLSGTFRGLLLSPGDDNWAKLQKRLPKLILDRFHDHIKSTSGLEKAVSVTPTKGVDVVVDEVNNF